MIEALAIIGGIAVTFAFYFQLFFNPPRPRRKRK